MDVLLPQLQQYEQKTNRTHVNFIVCKSIDDLLQQVDKYRDTTPLEIIFIDPPTTKTEVWEYLSSDASTIKWVHSPAAGVDAAMKNLEPVSEDVKTRLYTKIQYTRRAGLMTPKSMSEYILMAMLTTERSYDRLKKNTNDGLWSRDFTSRLLSDCHVGIMGYGSIGKHIAQTLNTLGIKISVLRRSKGEPDEFVSKYYSTSTPNEFEEFLASGIDYLVAILPSTKETQGLLNNDVLENCKNSSPVFLSLGRGDVISDDAVVKALDNKWLSRAVMDVFEKEPLPIDSPLWKREDVLISPHCSCISPSVRIETIECFYNNLERFMQGQELEHNVDWEQGY
jgi:phosphoglycerate dehydrogenase-like enzyme